MRIRTCLVHTCIANIDNAEICSGYCITKRLLVTRVLNGYSAYEGTRTSTSTLIGLGNNTILDQARLVCTSGGNMTPSSARDPKLVFALRRDMYTQFGKLIRVTFKLSQSIMLR